MPKLVFVILASSLVLILAVFFIVFVYKKRPDRAIQQHVVITVNHSRTVAGVDGRLLLEIKGKRLSGLITAFIWLLVGLVTYNTSLENKYIYLLPCVFGLGLNICRASRSILLYEYSIIAQNILFSNVYYLSDVNTIQTINVANCFGRTASFGYLLTGKGKRLSVFAAPDYDRLERLEIVFSEVNPCIKSVAKI